MSEKKIHHYRVDTYLEPNDKRFVEALAKVNGESKSTVVSVAVKTLKSTYSEQQIKEIINRAKLQD